MIQLRHTGLALILGCFLITPAVTPAAAQETKLVAASDLEISKEVAERDLEFKYIGARHVWVTYYSGPGGDRMGIEGLLERSLFVTAVNGSANWAKVRIQVFDSAGHLLIESDLGLYPGHSGELLDPLAYWLNRNNEIEPIPARVTLVASSDSPVALFAHEQDFNTGSQVEVIQSGAYASQYATESKRDIPFERIDCPEAGREWFCGAPTLATSWATWRFPDDLP